MRVVLLFVFSILVLFAVFTTIEAWHAQDSHNWPTAKGTVTAFYETPNYTYLVGGKKYAGSYVSCNEFFSRNEAIRNSAKYAVRYPLEAQVSVYYNPRNPALSALETKFDPHVFIDIAFFVLMAGVCLLGFLFGRQRRPWRLFGF